MFSYDECALAHHAVDRRTSFGRQHRSVCDGKTVGLSSEWEFRGRQIVGVAIILGRERQADLLKEAERDRLTRQVPQRPSWKD